LVKITLSRNLSNSESIETIGKFGNEMIFCGLILISFEIKILRILFQFQIQRSYYRFDHKGKILFISS
jgi:hypothetical protein